MQWCLESIESWLSYWLVKHFNRNFWSCQLIAVCHVTLRTWWRHCLLTQSSAWRTTPSVCTLFSLAPILTVSDKVSTRFFFIKIIARSCGKCWDKCVNDFNSFRGVVGCFQRVHRSYRQSAVMTTCRTSKSSPSSSPAHAWVTRRLAPASRASTCRSWASPTPKPFPLRLTGKTCEKLCTCMIIVCMYVHALSSIVSSYGRNSVPCPIVVLLYV